MTYPLFHDPVPDVTPQRLPDWLVRMPAGTLEDAAICSGAALAMLHMVRARPDLPDALWRARLALTAAAHCANLAGRRENEAALRDETCLLRPGDQPGPAGAIALVWQNVIARPLSQSRLQRALPGLDAAQLRAWAAPGAGNPVAQAAQMIEMVLSDAPRDELTALILADAALARALGWDHLIPLLGAGMPRRDLTARGDALRLACHQALIRSIRRALPLAAGLSHSAARLKAVAPKLRAKAAPRAIELFLTRDATAPAQLTGAMSDRAARRLCDRLVALGALRELTGRDTFRLFGL
ncbi:DUF1403 family protein [Roseinatronobacter alkalisoli]|uniref:DUF1403 family protein n=1 Tax=Roseinatronobacter alkalisoli TaxID=3028235 RepID=A0ABT5TEY4_9RHOB|nr:DUF1403 family protein [Roseinatronobacter sp. HJB301]MDD7973566.1 DUF1403 family protein [Roseinatronobacter sp. HJB301]